MWLNFQVQTYTLYYGLYFGCIKFNVTTGMSELKWKVVSDGRKLNTQIWSMKWRCADFEQEIMTQHKNTTSSCPLKIFLNF